MAVYLTRLAGTQHDPFLHFAVVIPGLVVINSIYVV